jgi:L-ascorbate metabolism protein UlaG (beta-lactamase superfamily)
VSIKITWHGHATFSLDISGTKIVVDPFLAGNNPVAKSGVADLEADYILQTHGHGDHIADTVPLAKATGAQVIANFEICNWLNKQGCENTWAMNTGGSYQFPFGRVKMTPALHSSGLPDGSYGGDPGGFLIFSEGKTIYIAGDTALFSDMALIGSAGLDLAIIPTGDNFTMGPDDALEALRFLNPTIVIPCHYGTFPMLVPDMNDWAASVRASTTVVPVILDIDESVHL